MIAALVLVAALSFIGMVGYAVWGDLYKIQVVYPVLFALCLASVSAAFIGYEAGWFR